MTPLLHGRNHHDLYEWPLVQYANKSAVVVSSSGVVVLAFQTTWHGCLSYPSFKIFNKLASTI